MATQTATRQKASKHSRKRTHDESALASSQAGAGEGSRSKKARTLGHVKLHTSPTGPSESTSESTSPFATVRAAFYLTLSPITSSKGHALAGLCLEHLSPLLLTYYAPLGGVVLAYNNVVLSSAPPTANSTKQQEAPMAVAIDEGAAPHVWLAADFTLLEPRRGARLQGYASVVTQSHVGLICYNLFNASIPARHLPKGWSWRSGGIEDDGSQGGHWVDESGDIVCTADGDSPTQLDFRVRDFESGGGGGAHGVGARDRGFLTLEGTLLGEAEEAELIEAERKQQQTKPKQGQAGKQRRQDQGTPKGSKKKKQSDQNALSVEKDDDY